MEAQVPCNHTYHSVPRTETLKSSSVEMTLLVPKVPDHHSNHPQCFSLERMSDNKFHSLRKKMMRMKDTMDSFGIFCVLERRHDSIEAMKFSYLKCCTQFCQEKVPKATTNYQTYLVKCAAYRNNHPWHPWSEAEQSSVSQPKFIRSCFGVLLQGFISPQQIR